MKAYALLCLVLLAASIPFAHAAESPPPDGPPGSHPPKAGQGTYSNYKQLFDQEEAFRSLPDDKEIKNALCYKYLKSGSSTLSQPEDAGFGEKVTCTSPWSPDVKPIHAGERLSVVVRTDIACTNLVGYFRLIGQTNPPVDIYQLRPAKPFQEAKGFLEPHNCYATIARQLPGETFVVAYTFLRGEGEEKSKPAEGTVTLPPIHSVYHFGLSTGVIVSTLRNPTFAYNQGATTTSFEVDRISNPHFIDPVFFLHYYPRALDPSAGGDWSPDNQSVVFGVSLKSASTNIYLGYAFEPIRNVALVIGVHTAQVPRQAPFDSGASATHSSPSTVSTIQRGGFLGLTFNFSNFLQASMFK